MRVLHWFDRFGTSIGGVETLASVLLARLRDRGYRQEVVTGRFGRDLPPEGVTDGIPLHRFGFHTILEKRDLPGIVRARSRLVSLLERFRPDVVHFHLGGGTSAGYFLLLATRDAPAPTLITVHGLGPSLPPESPLLRDLIQSATRVVTVSHALRREVTDFMPRRAAPVSVIHNGVASPAQSVGAAESTPPVALCVGRLAHEKGFDLAIAAFPAVLARVPEARLVVAGGGGERANLEARSRTLGLGDAVQFIGWVHPREVPALMGRARAVVVPSRYEAFGLVALEAAWMGRPVVATRVGGLPEVVVDGETGILVEPGDPEALGRAVGSLLAEPAEAARLGEAGRARAPVAFSLEHFVEAYDNLYRDLAEDGD